MSQKFALHEVLNTRTTISPELFAATTECPDAALAARDLDDLYKLFAHLRLIALMRTGAMWLHPAVARALRVFLLHDGAVVLLDTRRRTAALVALGCVGMIAAHPAFRRLFVLPLSRVLLRLLRDEQHAEHDGER